jgi:hypothetical protein
MNRRSAFSLKDIPITKLQLPPKTRTQTRLQTSSEFSSSSPSIMSDAPALHQSQSQQQTSSMDSFKLNNESSAIQFHLSGQTVTNLCAKDQPTTSDLLYSNQPKTIQNNDETNHSEDNKKIPFDSNGQFSDDLVDKPSLLDFLHSLALEMLINGSYN